MIRKPRLLLSWSSGKNSAWALHRLRMQDDYELAGLVTTVNEVFGWVAMHGVRAALLEAQAAPACRCGASICRGRARTKSTKRACALIERARAAGVTHMAFGDLFLEDMRAYRERQRA